MSGKVTRKIVHGVHSQTSVRSTDSLKYKNEKQLAAWSTSKRPCSSVPVQRPTVCLSVPDRHALCQCGPTGSSEVMYCSRWPVFQHRLTTSLEHFAYFCSWHKLVLALQGNSWKRFSDGHGASSVELAPLNTLTYLLTCGPSAVNDLSPRWVLVRGTKHVSMLCRRYINT